MIPPIASPLAGLERRLRTLTGSCGMHALGIADMTPEPVQAAVAATGGRWLSAFPRAVSVVFRLQNAIVEELPDHHREKALARLYEFHIYRVGNPHLDQVATRIATEIQEAGYRAVPVPTSVAVDGGSGTGGFLGAVSHKMAAHLSGLGWIGRSCLLVTPDVGPRVRLATVMTDAPFAARTPADAGCGRCRICVRACPAQAFSGKAFDPADPIEARMDVRACEAYRQEAKTLTGVPMCGVCVAVCPHGKPGRRLTPPPAPPGAGRYRAPPPGPRGSRESPL
ncbi:MAG: 4Fe-4S dicluster domain-containing protein [Thermoleophilia bacterium]|nr:4Fe-4S dicluster domain-containing protein [Thermoleophilia bacterium]